MLDEFDLFAIELLKHITDIEDMFENMEFNLGFDFICCIGIFKREYPELFHIYEVIRFHILIINGVFDID